jgi:outer membrane protein TolC
MKESGNHRKVGKHGRGNPARRALLCLALVLSPVLEASAVPEATQSKPAPQPDELLTLDAVLRQALRQSPQIRRVNAALADRLATATEIQVLPNPEVQIQAAIGADNTGPVDLAAGMENMITQSFRISHFGMRQAYASALKTAANLEQQAEILGLLNEAVLQYYRLWMLQKRETFLSESETEARAVVTRIDEALASQEIPMTEGALFKAEAVRFSVELRSTQAERMQAQATLLETLGSPWKEVRLLPPQLESIPTDPSRLVRFARKRGNLQKLLEQKLLAASRRHEVAEMDIFPELSVQGIYDGGVNGESGVWGAGVVVRIPLWDQNQAEIQRAEAQRALAEAESQAMDRITFERIVEIRMKRAVALQERAEAYWNDVIPAYQKSYTSGRNLFDQGQANMMQLWQLQRQVADANEKAMQDTVAALAARSMLEQAIGGKIEEIPQEPN